MGHEDTLGAIFGLIRGAFLDCVADDRGEGSDELIGFFDQRLERFVEES
jgi:hypothetical protein